MTLLRHCLVDAQELGEINAQIDVAQLVFEVEAMLLAANFLFLMGNDLHSLTQARRGVENVLSRSGAPVKSPKKRPTRRGRMSK